MVLDHRRGEKERVSLMCVLPLQSVNDSSTEMRVIMTADSLGVLHVSTGMYKHLGVACLGVLCIVWASGGFACEYGHLHVSMGIWGAGVN